MPKNSNIKENLVVNIQPDMLPITLEVYAGRTGQSISAVRAQASRGTLPTMQMGKSSTIYVNQAQMIMSSLEAAGWDVRTPKNIYAL
ncbi:hypothetical protein PE36_12837 [Moritella sp. PE36]|uniref:hypothetical protein n=1 Tax=Moritella sp. PE36 TaxID=58051 RepID=UPI0001568B9C|nr:hypothetical protein [Moritella sp. PE36]EDM65032.1 hypothetical protein PE36_12837 [Moritella sp. PE36]